jgi:hypothetical protein
MLFESTGLDVGEGDVRVVLGTREKDGRLPEVAARARHVEWADQGAT